MADKPLDAYHRHEVLHAVHIIESTFAAHVTEHPAVLATPALRVAAAKAADALAFMYQEAGRVRFNEE